MLKIKDKHHIDFPFVIEGLVPKRQLQFVPVPDDDDELTRAIASDSTVHDDEWVLTERPDPDQLDAFWAKVMKDLAQDPDWTFENDK